ncbi:hypothetical protein [Methylocystis sp. ATCC 49242]|uniref:hypothetical protein n=1 Tax=Methylocystis sp. ATCC 49242 TaxID=622637 RepID=UPI0002DA78AE|nr:hypothetical protein [Methylocystis sp. ATCC 49242]
MNPGNRFRVWRFAFLAAPPQFDGSAAAEGQVALVAVKSISSRAGRFAISATGAVGVVAFRFVTEATILAALAAPDGGRPHKWAL